MESLPRQLISLTKVREFNLLKPTAGGRRRHLSAASGLVCINSLLYVIADDELSLGVFEASGSEPGHLIELFSGTLPDAKAERKKQKPDFEALTLLPAHQNCPFGALLALGSGSRANRRMGAILEIDVRGAVLRTARVVDLSAILASLDSEFPEVNIEGAAVSGDEILLFQRGNKRHAENALIGFQLAGFIDAMNSRDTRKITPSRMAKFDLGEIDGVPLCFTDATPLPDGSIVFTAVAEDTDDSYRDGACGGAAVGVLDKNGSHAVHRLDWPHKIEGVHAAVDGDVVRLLLVTDPDNADIPSELFSASLRR
jgi:hypothetical protein